MRSRCAIFAASALLLMGLTTAAQEKATLRGKIVDSQSGKLLPARLYIESAEGQRFTARSADPQGSAVEYNKRRSPQSVEVHTTLSAHPFLAELPPGQYTITAERGKEYLPASATMEIGGADVEVTLRLKRWINMAAAGWYSGETHVHRSIAELPNAMLADDLNVALPLTYWVTQAGLPPGQGNKNSPDVKPQLIRVDPTHVIYPMNTEYEIFTVDGKRHPLGAIFGLNHKSVLKMAAPPVRPIAQQVHDEGGLLELDKHNWPWSMMLVPVMDVDLYELTNNHIWRTDFHFYQFYDTYAPDFMNVQRNQQGMTERGWIDFTFGNYYTLLDCGFRLRPTGGTASGVHPVPLGYGRVYVQTDGDFSYDRWIQGLDAGRSFVTTGPMLDVKLNGRWPGHTFNQDNSDSRTYRLSGAARSAAPLSKIEIVSAGRVVSTIEPANIRRAAGGYESPIAGAFDVKSSTWFAVRCYEPTEGERHRFAHSAPFHIDVAGEPLRPRRVEVQYLIDRVEDEIDRNRGVLSDQAMQEYRAALAVYQRIAQSAK